MSLRYIHFCKICLVRVKADKQFFFIGKSKKAMKLIEQCVLIAESRRVDDSVMEFCKVNKKWIQNKLCNHGHIDDTSPLLLT